MSFSALGREDFTVLGPAVGGRDLRLLQLDALVADGELVLALGISALIAV